MLARASRQERASRCSKSHSVSPEPDSNFELPVSNKVQFE
jgi:hypothetical protein